MLWDGAVVTQLCFFSEESKRIILAGALLQRAGCGLRFNQGEDRHEAAAAAHRSDGCGTRHTLLPLKSKQPFGCFLSAWHFPQPVTHSHAGMMHISSTAEICGCKTDENDVHNRQANNRRNQF
jgi:hypothetical protein